MKCTICGSEWNTKSSYSQIKNCPFCGSSLMKNDQQIVEVKISEVMKQIIDRFGEDIILQKTKFLSIMSDFAPKLKKERKILSVAMDENIAELFLNCPYNDRDAHILTSKRKLEGILSESAVELVVTAFAEALEWEIVLNNDVVTNQSNNTNLNKTYEFGNSDELLIIVKNLLNGSPEVFDFDTQRFTDENMNSDFKSACMELNSEHLQKAFALFEKLAYPNFPNTSTVGNVLAAINLAQMYYLGDGVKRSPEKAAHILVSLIPYKNPLVFAWISELFYVTIPGLTVKDTYLSKEIYQRCAENLNIMAYTGYPDAEYFIGFNLIYGINCEKNEIQGFNYIKSSAKSGNIRAAVEMALCYMDGIGVSTDVAKGIALLKKIEHTQNAKAQYRLGLIYFLDKYNEYIPHNESIAFNHFMNAAKTGHKNAQDYVGDFYYYGYSVKKDFAEARRWYEMASLAGNIHATEQLGDIYYYGEGVTGDVDKAYLYYKDAADRGNTHSQYMLHYYYFGDCSYKDYEKGRRYLEMAAENGSAKSQKLLARLYISDYGFNDDFKFAYWMKKAADQGDPEAERIYGQAIYKFGNEKVFKKDYKEAVTWLSRASSHGDIEATIELATLLSTEQEVGVDADMALRFVQSAMKMIYEDAQNDESKLASHNDNFIKLSRILIKIGRIYMSKNNQELGFQIYEMSVSLNENAENCRLLGMSYKNGTGVKKDKKKAKDYLRKAASLGDDLARAELNKLFF